MDGHDFKDSVELVGEIIDGLGVGVVVLGIAVASVIFASRALRADGFPEVYRAYRQGLGRAILLGLELLVAADIIRTVAVSPSFRGAGVLAIIVLIRTFLSATLEVEIEGRWPWQTRASPGTRSAPPQVKQP
ncbi:MAG: DUF1622 domain-containing protein [Actinomycetota bacterium]|nr:DUF1622 domain-containing protein [Actinomycetota bacterium]